MITIVSGVPGCGVPLVLNMLEAGGIPVLHSDRVPEGTDDPLAFVPPAAFSRTAPDMTWLAEAEGKACRLDWAHLVHLPANHEYRIVFLHRTLEDLPACRPRAAAPDDTGGRPPEVVYQALERQLWRVTRWLDGPRQVATWYCHTDDLIEQPAVAARQLEEFMGLRLNINAMVVSAERHRMELVVAPRTDNPIESDKNQPNG